MTAMLTQGANIRNGGSSKGTTVLGSLPGGTVVNVIGCNNSWCQLALPQFQVAWTAKKFLQFGDFGGQQQPEMPQMQGDMQQGGMQPPPQVEMQQGGGGAQMASTCALGPGTATVTIADPNVTTLNVRDKPGGNILTQIPVGSQVNIVGGCGVKIAAGIVAQQPGAGGGGGGGVPGWCAISSPVIGCVSQQFLTAGMAPAAGGIPQGGAGLVANQPQGAVFTGNWNAEAQGVGYSFVMNQNGNNVSGSYSADDGTSGQINGKVKGNVLRFSWRQPDGLSGTGRFALSSDGGSFNGSYTLGNNPDVAEGSWNGTRN